MIIVLSTGRTGTTLLSNLINSVGVIRVTHQEKGSRIVNILGNMTIHQLFPVQKLNKILMKEFGSQKIPDSTTDPLRSIPISVFILDSEKRDDVKIIHLIRDPRDFVTSFMNWKNSSFKRQILHHLVPFWQPNPWLKGDITLQERLRMTKFEHFCWIWNYKNNFFSQLSDNKKYLCIRFEDLILNKKRETWEKVFSFLELNNVGLDDLDWPNKKVNKSEKKNFPDWENWTKEQAETLEKWCGVTMKKYNYGKEKKWKSLLK